MLDTAVYMAFCSKMYHAVNVIFGKDLCDRLFVRDIRTDECIIVSIFNVF